MDDAGERFSSFTQILKNKKDVICVFFVEKTKATQFRFYFTFVLRQMFHCIKLTKKPCNDFMDGVMQRFLFENYIHENNFTKKTM